jgi:hypothetical protein
LAELGAVFVQCAIDNPRIPPLSLHDFGHANMAPTPVDEVLEEMLCSLSGRWLAKSGSNGPRRLKSRSQLTLTMPILAFAKD